MRFQGQIADWSHSFSRLLAIVRGVVWDRIDLMSLLKSYGTAGGSYRMRATCALDMWSFGLIVFELFARQPYFSDKPDTMQQLASYAELEVAQAHTPLMEPAHAYKMRLVCSRYCIFFPGRFHSRCQRI